MIINWRKRCYIATSS